MHRPAKYTLLENDIMLKVNVMNLCNSCNGHVGKWVIGVTIVSFPMIGITTSTLQSLGIGLWLLKIAPVYDDTLQALLGIMAHNKIFISL